MTFKAFVVILLSGVFVNNYVLQQFLGVLDAVQGGTGKAGYFLCNDEVEPPCLGVGNHPKETIPLSGACSADTLVYVPRHIGPI